MSRTSYFKTISPQGDGNDPAPEGLPISSLFQNHIPARGRKLHPEIILLCRCRILKPYPRKGTETYNRRTNHASSRISKPYPRKGTEPTHRVNQPNKRAATSSLAALFVLSLLTYLFLFPRISSKNCMKQSFFCRSYPRNPIFFRKWYTIGRRGSLLRR